MGDPAGPRPPDVHVEIYDDRCHITLAMTDVPNERAYATAAAAAEFADVQETTGWGMDGDQAKPWSDADAESSGQANRTAALLGNAHAAACVQRSALLRNLERIAAVDEKLTVWDPYCGHGTLLLEALGICLGIPPASPAMNFPFSELPCFDVDQYGSMARSLELHPHPALSQLMLIGTHEDADQIQVARSNLHHFTRTLPRSRFDQAAQGLPCAVDFRE